MIVALGPALAGAQPAGDVSPALGLFGDLAADTLRSDIGTITGPTPPLRLVGVEPAPGADLFLPAQQLACADFDRDGWTDVLLASGFKTTIGAFPAEARLLWGRPDGRFETRDPSPVPRHIDAALRGDVDGDGLTDLVVLEPDDFAAPTAPGEIMRPTSFHRRLSLLRNLGGRRFAAEPLTGAARPPGAVSRPLVLSDLDGDGWLDLVTATIARDPFLERKSFGMTLWVGGPRGLTAGPGLDPPGYSHTGTLNTWTGDLDGDGRPELRTIACSNHMPYDTGPLENQLLLGVHPAPRWQPSRLVPTVGVIGVSLADIDGDGRPDVFAGVSDVAGGRNPLRLSGPGGWPDAGRRAGLRAGYAYTIGVWGDVDNDGRQDQWQCREIADGRLTHSRLYWNRGDTTFVDATAAVTPFAQPSSRAAAWIDTDQDGRLDVLATFTTTYPDSMPVTRCRPILYRNVGPAGAWIGLDLAGTPPNTDAIGASVQVWSRGRPQWRQVGDGSGDGGSAPPLTLHVGLGEADRADSVTVRWPWGDRETWRNLPAGRRHVLRQGTAPAGEPGGR